MNEYFRGDDIVVDMTFSDSSGSVLQPSTLNGYEAELREELNGAVVSIPFPQGDFEVVDDAAGELRLRIDRSETSTLAFGNYNLFVLLSFTDANAEGGKRVETIKTAPFKIMRR